MNGLFNNKFLLGMVMARNLPQQEQLTIGLAASQFSNMMGAVLLKPTIDGKVGAEAGKATAEGERDSARQEIAAAIAKLNATLGGNATTLDQAVTNAVDTLKAAIGDLDFAVRRVSNDRENSTVLELTATLLAVSDASATAILKFPNEGEKISLEPDGDVPPGFTFTHTERDATLILKQPNLSAKFRATVNGKPSTASLVVTTRPNQGNSTPR